MNTATWKIGLWLENDEGLYNGARDCADGDSLEDALYERITDE